MPRKPKKPCGHPGCPALTENRYCDEHSKLNKYENKIRAIDDMKKEIVDL